MPMPAGFADHHRVSPVLDVYQINGRPAAGILRAIVPGRPKKFDLIRNLPAATSANH